MAGLFQSTSGDIISLDNPKAGALTLATSLADFEPTSTDPVAMFARRDAFRTVAEAIAAAMAGVPLDLYRRDEKNGRTKLGEGEHPVATALDEPSPGMTQYRLREAIHLDRVLWDRWAVLMLQEDTGLQLVRLPGRWISFALDGFRRITDCVVTNPTTGKKLAIPIDRVIFDVGYDPTPAGDTTKGYPIARTLQAAATELERGAAYREALLAGGPKVPMYVSRPVDAGDWTKGGGRASFEQTFRAFSGERAGQVPVLEDGMKLEAAPQLDKDAVAYKDTRLAAQIEFAIAMHFPPELVGYRQGNFSNLEALRQQLYIDTLGNAFASERQAWNAGLRRGGYIARGREYVEENVAIRLAGNPELQASILQTQVGAPVRTVNEARRILNLPPMEGGDELIVPLNVVKGGLASPTDTGPKTLARDVITLPAGARRLELEGPADLKARTPKAYLSRLEKQRERFARDLRKTFDKQQSRVLKSLGSDSSPGALDDAYDVVRESDELAAVLLPHSYALAVTGSLIVLDRYNPDSENFDPDKMLPWLQKAAAGTALLIATSTFRDLAERVVGDDWLTKTAGYLGTLVESAPDLWATTVGTASTSFGQHDAAKASGLGRKTWIHVGGLTSRPEHAAMDGETVGIDELFSNGLRWPGDPSGGPEDNAQCNCRLEYSREP
jgi:phage portal protein BeeE